MILLKIGDETELSYKIKEELSFLGFDFIEKKAWTDDLIKECIKRNYEFASSYYMPEIRKMNSEQAFDFVKNNPKCLRKLIVIDEEKQKAVADFPKISLTRKTLKKVFGRKK